MRNNKNQRGEVFALFALATSIMIILSTAALNHIDKDIPSRLPEACFDSHEDEYGCLDRQERAILKDLELHHRYRIRDIKDWNK